MRVVEVDKITASQERVESGGIRWSALRQPDNQALCGAEQGEMVEKLVRATAVDRVASLSKWVRLREPPVPVAAEVPETQNHPEKAQGIVDEG